MSTPALGERWLSADERFVMDIHDVRDGFIYYGVGVAGAPDYHDLCRLPLARWPEFLAANPGIRRVEGPT